ncbi:MAG: PaaI family thioesterase [Clostridia bacterium]
MDYLKWAKETFKDDIYAKETTGIEIEEVGLNYAKCSLKLDKKHQNAEGEVMGGAIFTLADFTFAIASNTDGVLTVSLSSQINYLNKVRGKMLFAEANCSKTGKNVCFYDVTITDEEKTTIATVLITGFRKQPD